jgi:hypothetical protein
MLEKMLHHKLLKEGQQGQGVVTKRHDQAVDSSTNKFSILFEIEGHIAFRDGTQAAFKSEWLSTHKVGDIRAGAIVPVRYDPSDHSKVVLDVVALEEQNKAERRQDEAWQEEQKTKAIADADAEVAGGNT